MRLATLLNNYPRLRGEIGRAYRNHKWERTASGIRIIGPSVAIGGHAEHFLNDGPRTVDHNLLTDQGINYLLGVGIADATKVAEWNIAPFLGAVNPSSSTTAANFNSSLTEFIAYDESLRRPYVEVAGSKTMTNAASPAIITISTNASVVEGAGVLSATGKQASTGTCLAAIRFTAPREGLLDGDTLGFVYVLTGADDGA